MAVGVVILQPYERVLRDKSDSRNYFIKPKQSRPGRVIENYACGLAFDPDNAQAYLAMSRSFAAQGNHVQAADSIRRAIDSGLGVTLTYALLAKQQRLAGDSQAAEQTFTEGLKIFPGSVYLHVEYVLLENTGERISETTNADRLGDDHPTQRRARGLFAMAARRSLCGARQCRPSPPAELSRIMPCVNNSTIRQRQITA